MTITIEKEITISTGRTSQTHVLSVEFPDDGGDLVIMRRRTYGERWSDGRDLWELMSPEQNWEILMEADIELKKSTGLVVERTTK